jgi:hypothetical protein
MLPLIKRKFTRVPKYSNAGIVDQHVESAEFGIDEAEQFGNLIMLPNIGNFPFDFTGRFHGKLGDGAIHRFLTLPAHRHGSALL